MTMLARSGAGRTSPGVFSLGAVVVSALLLSLLCAAAMAAERGTVIRKAVIYVAPDVSSAKLATADRGHEAVVLERTPGWVHVIATLMDARLQSRS